MLTHPQVAGFLFTLSKAIPTFAPDIRDPELVSIWHNALKGFEFELLSKAGMQLMMSESNFPSLARVLQVLGAANKSVESFDGLVALISKHGGYRPPTTVSYSMAMTINRLGGWQKICEWTNADLPFRRKDFDAVHQEVSDFIAIAIPEGLEPIRLLGIHKEEAISPPGLQNQTLLQESKEPIREDALKTKVDWEAICAAHRTRPEKDSPCDVDLNIPNKLKEKGFFKLFSRPGLYFRYCYGAIPGKGWPHSFVDADEHVSDAKRKQEGKIAFDPNKFDSSKYEVRPDTFVD